jgi:transcriptional regulator of acetoin/glycerol metabolism
MSIESADPNSTLSETGERPRPVGEPVLIYLGSPEKDFVDAGRVLPLDEVRLVRFGRVSSPSISWKCDSEVAHVGVPVPWVSSAHAELSLRRREDGVYSLRDLGSRNGTHVEGRRMARATRLRPGEVFELGRTFWMVRELPKGRRSGPQPQFPGVVASANPELNAAYQQLARIARSDLSIMLQGETGTGKHVMAQAIHTHSGREGEFVSINLAAISDEKLDALLDGEQGLFARAKGGTLFFNELAELSPAAQSKLLAALDRNGVGSEESGVEARSGADVRIISSTLVNLDSSGPQRSFRPDLHARLSGYVVHLPPLRARREDIGSLCASLADGGLRMGTPAFRRMLAYRWPFNLRELRQTLATAKLLAGEDGELTSELIADLLARRADAPSDADSIRSLREQIVRTLASHGGETAPAAEALQLSAADLHRWIERFDIQPEDYVDSPPRTVN